MLKLDEIRELIQMLDDSSIDTFKYEHKDFAIELTKGHVNHTTNVTHAAPAPAQELARQQVVTSEAPENDVVEKGAEEQDRANTYEITSPMVGTFYSSPSPDDPVYVNVGDRVSKDTVVCLVEAMKVFNEIEAEVNGTIVEVLVENGQLVEHGQPLFLVKTE